MGEVERAKNPLRPRGGTVEASGAENPLSEMAKSEVSYLLRSAQRRTATPIRKSFVRNDDAGVDSPLSQLVATKGRGAAVPLALYLGLVRRSSAAPYTTVLSARRWAALLDLDDPVRRGARRVQDGLDRLEGLNLISLDRRRGETPVVTLLREDGSGDAYAPPRGAGRGRKTAQEELYFKVPDTMWNGRIQNLSAPSLAMLLVLASEPSSTQQRGTWWSVEEFPKRYGLSASMRARGTKDLIAMGLLSVTKRKIDTPRGGNSDNPDRVRNVYRLIGAANANVPGLDLDDSFAMTED